MHARQTPSGLEIITRNPAAWADGIPFHPVPADQQALIDRNWVCVDGVFSPPTDTYLAEQAQQQFERARAQRLATARAAVDAAARALVAHISSTEQQTWPTQLAEAQLVNSWRDIPDRLPPPSYYPLLALMATQRGYGESVFELADRVLSAAAQYTAAAGPLVAWGQRTERALNAAQTLAELNAISLTPPSPAPAPAPEPVASQPE